MKSVAVVTASRKVSPEKFGSSVSARLATEPKKQSRAQPQSPIPPAKFTLAKNGADKITAPTRTSRKRLATLHTFRILSPTGVDAPAAGAKGTAVPSIGTFQTLFDWPRRSLVRNRGHVSTGRISTCASKRHGTTNNG